MEQVGVDDELQISAVFAGTMAGHFLPIQLIYKGKASKCLSFCTFSTYLHSKSLGKREYYAELFGKNFFLCIELKRKDLELVIDHPALVILNRFSAQCTNAVLQLLHEHHVCLVIVPMNFTDSLQPLDVLLTKDAKGFIFEEFQDWYAHQVYIQIHRW